jgi:hypothetical protein
MEPSGITFEGKVSRSAGRLPVVKFLPGFALESSRAKGRVSTILNIHINDAEQTLIVFASRSPFWSIKRCYFM